MTPDSETLVKLAGRCEAGPAGDQRELLWQAFRAAHDTPTGVSIGIHDRFIALLDAGGFLDAAMTLVPEGWVVARIGQDDGKRWWAELRHGFITSFDEVVIGENSAWAPHWDQEPPLRGCHGAALALCAASLRARAAK